MNLTKDFNQKSTPASRNERGGVCCESPAQILNPKIDKVLKLAQKQKALFKFTKDDPITPMEYLYFSKISESK